MPTQIFVPGPVKLSVSTGEAGALEFLGWSEGDTRFAPTGHFEAVHTDQSGPYIPMDRQYFGTSGHVSFTLVQFTWAVFRKLLARRMGSTPGLIGTQEIGTLMRLEGGAFRLLMELTYQAKQAFASMDSAFNAPTCIIPDTVELPISSRVTKPRLTIEVIPTFAANGSAIVWNNDATGAPPAA
jgi:hypothetical protein